MGNAFAVTSSFCCLDSCLADSNKDAQAFLFQSVVDIQVAELSTYFEPEKEKPLCSNLTPCISRVVRLTLNFISISRSAAHLSNYPNYELWAVLLSMPCISRAFLIVWAQAFLLIWSLPLAKCKRYLAVNILQTSHSCENHSCR